jgi:hypothetical protein
MNPAYRNVVAALVLIFVASCSLIVVVAVAAVVDLCKFVVADERGADVFASNLRFHPEIILNRVNLVIFSDK